MNVGKSAGGPRSIIAFWVRRFAGRAAITAAAVAVFGDACFYGGLDSILLEDSFPKGVKLLCINFL